MSTTESSQSTVNEVTRQTATSWIVEVIADSSGTWASNGLRFAQENDAITWGDDLFMRWTAVRKWRVVPSSDEPNR